MHEAENVFGSEEYDCGVDLFIGEEKRDFEKKKGGWLLGSKFSYRGYMRGVSDSATSMMSS